MNKKVFKIFIIMLLIFSFCISYVSATNIDLNLPGTSTTTNTETNNEVQVPANNEVSSNNSVDTNIDNSNVNDVIDNIGTSTPAESLQPSGISTSSETELGITNIINILLITVGVILILLSIAILIRLK